MKSAARIVMLAGALAGVASTVGTAVAADGIVVCSPAAQGQRSVVVGDGEANRDCRIVPVISVEGVAFAGSSRFGEPVEPAPAVKPRRLWQDGVEPEVALPMPEWRKSVRVVGQRFLPDPESEINFAGIAERNVDPLNRAFDDLLALMRPAASSGKADRLVSRRAPNAEPDTNEREFARVASVATASLPN